MLILSKDLLKAKMLDSSPQSLAETNKFNLEPPFNSQLQKPVCIGDMVIFENVCDEDLTSNPVHTFFVNSVSEDMAPMIFLPSNSSISDIVNENKNLVEQAKSLESIIVADRRENRTKSKSSSKNNKTDLNKDVCTLKQENQQIKTELGSLKKENQQLKQENQQLKIEVDTLKQENQQLKIEVNTLKQENQQIKQENQQIKQENQQLRTCVDKLVSQVTTLQLLIDSFIGSGKDASFVKTVNTAMEALTILGNRLDKIYQTNDWLENIFDLRRGLAENQMVVSPLEDISLEELKQSVELFNYWNSNRTIRNNLAHFILTIDEIKHDSKHVLYPYLGLLEKLLK